MTKTIQKISKYRPSALQGTLQLEVLRPRVGLATEHPYERRAFSILLCALGVFALLYVYFVTASVMHVMARTEATKEAQAIESSIGSTEGHYLALSRSVTPDAAPALGLAPISHTSYVYRPGNAAVRPTSGSVI